MRALIDLILLIAGIILVVLGISKDIVVLLVLGIVLLLISGVVFIYIKHDSDNSSGSGSSGSWLDDIF